MGATFLTFDYSHEQWTQIVKSVQHLQPTPEALDEARYRLRQAARSYFLTILNRPGEKRQEQWKVKHWRSVEKHVEALISDFEWLRRDKSANGPPSPDGSASDPYRDDLRALMRIKIMSSSRVVDLTARFDDGFPKATPKAWYQSVVLEEWVGLGGRLKISRHPLNGQIKGPLARYFSAVTEPVHGGSPESLPDIVRRHVELRSAIERWRVEMAVLYAPREGNGEEDQDFSK